MTPRLSDAELVTLATMQAILGSATEAEWLRQARAHPSHVFPYLPRQPGYNKRQGRWSDAKRQPDPGRHHLGVERRRRGRGLHPGGMPPHPRDRQTLRPGRQGRLRLLRPLQPLLLGPRLHLVGILQGLPIAFVLTGAKADERETLLDLLAAGCEPLRERPRQSLIGDQSYFGPSLRRRTVRAWSPVAAACP